MPADFRRRFDRFWDDGPDESCFFFSAFRHSKKIMIESGIESHDNKENWSESCFCDLGWGLAFIKDIQLKLGGRCFRW